MNRKDHHIAFGPQSQSAVNDIDPRFNYEPLFVCTENQQLNPINFFDQQLEFPLWISSMTGGAQKAADINKNLAAACAHFGLGMGLGSLRPLMQERRMLSDYQLREIAGAKTPLYGNLGIAQLHSYLENGEITKFMDLCSKLDLDGLFIHVNPLQEWYQPEGDRFPQAPIQTLMKFKEVYKGVLFVKEVGQGMGPRSLNALIDLGVDGIELASFGGTNFSKLENSRRESALPSDLCNVGHTHQQMMNNLSGLLKGREKGPMIIVSGGVRSMLDAHYYQLKYDFPSIVAMGTPLMEKAILGEKELFNFIENLKSEYLMARACLELKEDQCKL